MGTLEPAEPIRTEQDVRSALARKFVANADQGNHAANDDLIGGLVDWERSQRPPASAAAAGHLEVDRSGQAVEQLGPDVLVLHVLHCADVDVLCIDSGVIYRAGRRLPSHVLPVARRLLLDGRLVEVVDSTHPATMAQRLRLSESGRALLCAMEAERPADHPEVSGS